MTAPKEVKVTGTVEMALSRHGEILVPPCGISTPQTSQRSCEMIQMDHMSMPIIQWLTLCKTGPLGIT